MLVELTRASATDGDRDFAADQVAAGANETVIARRLVRRGLNPRVAERVATYAVEENPSGGRNRVAFQAVGLVMMLTGGGWVLMQFPGNFINWAMLVFGWLFVRDGGWHPPRKSRRPAAQAAPRENVTERRVGRGMLLGLAGGALVGMIWGAIARGLDGILMGALLGPIPGLLVGLIFGLVYALARKLTS